MYNELMIEFLISKKRDLNFIIMFFLKMFFRKKIFFNLWVFIIDQDFSVFIIFIGKIKERVRRIDSRRENQQFRGVSK